MNHSSRRFSAPVFLGAAFFVFGLAGVERVLNMVGWSLPVLTVFPRQLLDWAVTLLMFEIALTLRQLMEMRLGNADGDNGVGADPRLH